MSDTKTCSRCKEERLLKEYTVDSRSRDRLRSECKICQRYDNIYKRKLENTLLSRAKGRAKRKNLQFNLELEDIVVPQYCPVLGIKLEPNRGGEKVAPNSPSIDRIDNNKGYTKDNIKIISHKANTIKSSATVEELKAIIEYMSNG